MPLKTHQRTDAALASWKSFNGMFYSSVLLKGIPMKGSKTVKL